ncbi:hypothetical protein FH972_017042 [Carpinus fangiana]|uniref:Uncharacterized protein n=1 Tax=Carpinus fangiana TaxID=176857 RepID=A0A5N6RL19_9ROSI|nr:hypothetical protein FH972_017042 [Carpinus fangiana]
MVAPVISEWRCKSAMSRGLGLRRYWSANPRATWLGSLVAVGRALARWSSAVECRRSGRGPVIADENEIANGIADENTDGRNRRWMQMKSQMDAGEGKRGTNSLKKRRKSISSRSSLYIRTTTPRVDTSARLCTAAGPPARCFSYNIVVCVSEMGGATYHDGALWYCTKWYTFSVQADGGGKVYPKPLRHFWRGKVPSRASLATLGPHVYAFGGVNFGNPTQRESRECYRLRITPQVGKEFVPVSPMVSGRCSPETSVLGNKIYLLTIPNPPNYRVQDPESIVLSAVVENPERVIVAYRSSYGPAIFYAYNVRHSAGNTLYWIKRKEALKDDLLFIAYDLNLDMWLKGCLKGHILFFFRDYGYLDGEGSRPVFFHLEKQRFCLLQFAHKADYIRCVVVDVSPMRGMKTLDIEVVCDQKYAMEPTNCPALAFCDIV